MCIFCDIIEKKIPSRVVYEDEHVLSILDINPMAKGHTLVFPKKHVKDFLDSDLETIQTTIAVTKKLSEQIVERLGAEGCNIVTNCGEAGGQSVEHLHFHIVPRMMNDGAITFKETPAECNLDEVLELIK